MLRIAHISDLHFRSEKTCPKEDSNIQQLAKFIVEKELSIKVERAIHDQNVLDALWNSLAEQEPDLIVATGDITDLGDTNSFAEAKAFFERLLREKVTKRIVCVPGNHDCLAERAALILQKKSGSIWMKLIAALNDQARDIYVAGQGQKLVNELDSAISVDRTALLKNYETQLVNAGFGFLSPDEPIAIDAAWGEVILFPFNSTNDPGIMANKGKIGPKQYNLLNKSIHELKRQGKFLNSIRIALLHHHPISSPLSPDGDVNRAYDWMDDGPLFVSHLESHGFHLVLHGHQHSPFACSVEYQPNSTDRLHIVAAGSCTQASDRNRPSFQMIHLFTPFHAELRYFEYESTGFHQLAGMARSITLRKRTAIRVSDPGEPETVEDWAMQQLIFGSYEFGTRPDQDIRYALLEFDVRLSANHLYAGTYRRVGTFLGRGRSGGPIFVLVGSPAMTLQEMNISAKDNKTGKSIEFEVLIDEGNRKVLQVLLQTQLDQSADFDISLSFQWQASEKERNDWDGINLMPFRREVGAVRYSVLMPWKPKQPRVVGYGASTVAIKPDNEQVKNDENGGGSKYTFELISPRRIAYLIAIGP